MSRLAVVVGGGTMGAGIAQLLLETGIDVTVCEATSEAAEAARNRVDEGLRKAVSRPGTLPKRSVGRLSATCGFDGTGPVDLVVEAVPEVVSVKQAVLRRAQSAFPGALLATNTSSLSIDELARELAEPSALVGMHFFNPVPSSSLIEIVIGTATDPSVVERARMWAEQMGKQAIEVRDSPGFATSRLGLAIGLEAMRMLQEGVASAADIDRAMVLGYKYPIGPLELTDRVGLDVRLAIARHLESELGPRFAPPQVLIDLVGHGHLGRKTGQGFYRWEGRRRVIAPPSQAEADA
jgi:3-hydroxybutyryl-CoA dehydrogenase